MFSNKFTQLSNVIAVVDFNKMIPKTRNHMKYLSIIYLFCDFFFPYSKCGHELMPKANEREREKEWGRRKKIIESLPTMKSYSKRDPNLDIQACNTRCNMYVKWLHFPPILYAYTHTMLLPKSKALELLKNSIILQFKPFSLGVFLSP